MESYGMLIPMLGLRKTTSPQDPRNCPTAFHFRALKAQNSSKSSWSRRSNLQVATGAMGWNILESLLKQKRSSLAWKLQGGHMQKLLRPRSPEVHHESSWEFHNKCAFLRLKWPHHLYQIYKHRRSYTGNAKVSYFLGSFSKVAVFHVTFRNQAKKSASSLNMIHLLNSYFTKVA